MEKLRIVIGGFIGLYPTGGVTWDYIQYVIGLRQLGHDVYYLEDTCQYPRYQSPGKSWDDSSDSIEYLKKTMLEFGLENRWAYRDVSSGRCFGLSIQELNEICSTADVFINISASTFLREEYLRIPKRVLIDSDPMFTQIDYLADAPENSIDNVHSMKFIVDHHNHHFSFGENIGQPDCRIPVTGIRWKRTRQPICMDHWLTNEPNFNRSLTTIMNWSVRPDLIYDSEEWGQKNKEFEKLLSLPLQIRDINFELIITGIDEAHQLNLQANHWNLIDPMTSIPDSEKYRQFIYHSMAEISVAKQTYVKSNSGWFSCRSACYLAAGRPVITQDTQWTKYIPAGLGLLSFNDLPSAITAVEELKSNYARHSKSAREMAFAFFNSDKVLADLLENIN